MGGTLQSRFGGHPYRVRGGQNTRAINLFCSEAGAAVFGGVWGWGFPSIC